MSDEIAGATALQNPVCVLEGPAPPAQPAPPAKPAPPAEPGPPSPPASAPAMAPRRRWRRRAVVAIATAVVMVAGLLMWAPWAVEPPAAPQGVGSGSVTATSAVIVWAAPTGGPEIDRYLVLRDGVQLATAAATVTSYFDRGLSPGTTYRYQIVAASGDTRSTPSAEVVVTTPVPPPVDLTVVSATSGSVALGWSAPADSPTPDSYEIVRDGNPIGTVPGTTTTYTDTGLAGATRYEYQARAIWGDQRSELSTVLAVRTRLSDAPLQGSYSVKVTLEKVPGGGASGQVGQTWTDTWEFTPQCAESTCDVVVSGDFAPPGFSRHSFEVRLARAGSEYRGSANAHITHCETVPGLETDVDNTVTVRLSGPAGDSWTSWSGSLVVNAPRVGGAIYTCPAQSWTTTLNATSMGGGASA